MIYKYFEEIIRRPEVWRMDINQIKCVDMIARCGNFSKAAEHLYITQPTLSQQIRRLEEELGFVLFDRTTRSVSLTEKGKIYLQHAAGVLSAYNHLLDEVEQLRDSTGCNLQVGVLPTFAHLNLLDTINQFQVLQENVSVNLQIYNSSALLDLLLSNQLDVVIANIFAGQLQSLDKHTVVTPLSRDRICVVLHEQHSLAGHATIRIEDLNHCNIIMLSKASSIRRHMDDALAEAGIVPAQIYECPAIHSMEGMIQSNTGVGFLSSRVAARYAIPPVVNRPLIPEIRTMTAILYRKNDPKAELLDEFRRMIMESVK